MERKDFIKTCGITCAGAFVIPTLLQSCVSSSYYAKSVLNGKKITINKSEFVQIVKEQKSFRKFVLVKVESVNFPICVYRFDKNSFTALSTECTHSGCEVKPQKEFLVCPCHGSEFNNKGVVLNSPAEQNLKNYKISTDNENVYVEL